jgi:hypothetical protein
MSLDENKKVKKKVYKKRGRKPKGKCYNVIKLSESSLVNREQKDENIIMHLPIKDDDLIASGNEIIGSDIFKYNPNIIEPEAYDSITDTSKFSNPKMPLPYDNKSEFLCVSKITGSKNSSKFETIKENTDENKKTPIKSKKNWISFTDSDDGIEEEQSKSKYSKITMDIIENTNDNLQVNISDTMVQFTDSISQNSWLKKTDIKCWWCCHDFDNSPCCIPEKYVNNTYYVYGCFCSFNCAVAHVLDNCNHNVWEKYSLLLDFCKEVYDDQVEDIKSAPPREVLRMFGGNLSIEQFRQNFTKFTNYKLVLPPMYSVNKKIDEYIIPSTENGKFVPLNFQKVKKATKNLTLMRNKPLKNAQSSLEMTMGLTSITK